MAEHAKDLAVILLSLSAPFIPAAWIITAFPYIIAALLTWRITSLLSRVRHA